MAKNTTGYSLELVGLQGLIDKFNISDDKVFNEVAPAIEKGCNLITVRQKQLIMKKSSNLANRLKHSKVFRTKDGSIIVKSGYFNLPIKKKSSDEVGFFDFAIMEYGRPGARKRESQTMTQTYTREDNSTYKVTKRIGKVNATPHIREGYDQMVKQAAKAVEESLTDLLKD